MEPAPVAAPEPEIEPAPPPLPQPPQPSTREIVLLALPGTLKELADKTGLTAAAVRNALWKLLLYNQIRNIATEHRAFAVYERVQ